MEKPTDVIAAVERDADNDAIWSVGGQLAQRIIDALEKAGWAIVPASQTDYGGWR